MGRPRVPRMYLPADADLVRRMAGITLETIGNASGYSGWHVAQVCAGKRPPSPAFLAAWSKLRVGPRAVERAKQVLELLAGLS